MGEQPLGPAEEHPVAVWAQVPRIPIPSAPTPERHLNRLVVYRRAYLVLGRVSPGPVVLLEQCGCACLPAARGQCR